ncbi:MAG: FliM/FliN family flagellar motor switch protein [Polyangiaceae bacterium]|nr:FliM/FliN family flagellar motor switch protein [Myxococcales bacterium]MCB9587304.1 FliM/FliN family flagellar motor switch protein [Polyangiaceae bacterium]MCB9605899.1 FliM/FliN family flagellar motor switch protein [Polyangiaceae bacterium]
MTDAVSKLASPSADAEARPSLGLEDLGASLRRGAPKIKPLDLTGRERHLRSAMFAMTKIAGGFCVGARRTLPFLVRQRARMVTGAVSIFEGGKELNLSDRGPVFMVVLDGDDTPAWGRLFLETDAVGMVLDGSLGGNAAVDEEQPAEPLQLPTELTLAQRALVGRIARNLADDFARAVSQIVGIELHTVSFHAIPHGEPIPGPSSDGLQVEVEFQGVIGHPKAILALSAESLEAAAREHTGEPQAPGDPRMAEALIDVSLNVVAELGRTTLGLRRILRLQPGEILRLPTATDDPVPIRVGGLLKLEGSPVISRGQLSVEVRGRAPRSAK